MKARKILKEELKHTKFHVLVIEASQITRLDSMREILKFCFQSKDNWDVKKQRKVHSYIYYIYRITNIDDLQSEIINSIILAKGDIGINNFIENSKIVNGNIDIGSNCIISGLNSLNSLCLNSDMCLQEIADSNNPKDFYLFLISIDDKTLLNYQDPKSTFMNKPWSDFFKSTNLKPDDIWLDIDEDKRCLYNAKLFPKLSSKYDANIVLWLQEYDIVSPSTLFMWKSAEKYSIEEINELGNPCNAFKWRWELYCEIGRKIMEDILVNKKPQQIKNVFEYIAHDKKQLNLYLRVFYNILLGFR